MVEHLSGYAPVASDPYPWPFDRRWSAADTALLLLGFDRAAVAGLDAGPVVLEARRLVAAVRGAGMELVLALRAGAEDALDAMHADDAFVSFGGDNAFYRTGLETHLRRKSIRNLMIAGLPTEGLVHASMRSANDMGFECLVVADACRGTDPAFHEAQLRITTFGNGLFGTVATTAAVLDAMASSTPRETS